MQVIDLSVPLNASTPVYPGDPATKLETISTLEADGHIDHYLSMVTHTGTHIDAPAHMLANGKTLDKFPASHFVGRGVYVKVENENFDLESVKKAGLKQGDIVLFHTGRSKSYYDPSYWDNIPVMTDELAQYLVGKQIKMVGFDTGSADSADDFPIHKILLGGNVLIIENLTNLDQLEDAQFTIYALPIDINVDGAPARTIAVIQ